MFFLSYGCINKILNRRVSLFDRAATSAISSLNTSFRLDLFSELSVCKCLEVNECGEIQESLLKLVLNDGQQSLRVYVNLDESKHNLRHTYESQEHCLDVGCVLLLLEYSHVQVKDLLGKTLLVNQLVDNIDLNESVIKLNSFLLLGHDDDDDQVKSSQKLLEAVQLHDQEEKEQDDNVMPRHTIESVRVDLSNSAWSLKCQVVERSLKLTFVHRDTLKEGHKMRLLLFDGLKYIECVAFDEHISRIESLTLERIYLIQNANVNVSKRLYKSWPNQADSVSEYDLGVKKETNFILLNEKHATLAQRNSDHQLKEKKNTPPPPSREEQSKVDKSERSEDDELVKETDNEQEEDEEEEEKKELVLVNKKQTPRMRGLDFKSITEIHKMKSANELVNVMGIVHTVYDAEMVSDSRKAPLSLLNIQLIDKAKYPIKVSLWGREADTFSHSVGDFLAFKSIKTMLYKNKISLSKTVKCEMLCEHDFDLNKCSAISDLTRWYADYAKVKKKKNSPSSREASSHSLVKKTKI